MKSKIIRIALLSSIMLPAAHGGTFLTATIDGDFSEWAGITVIDSDPTDNPGFVDFGDIRIANDNNYLYINVQYPGSLALGTFISIDVDSNTATGFDIFGLGLVGAEASWQNDFPFTNSTGIYNNGFGMSGDYFGSGAALIDTFADGPQREWAISLDILFNEDNSPVFDDANFTILIWTDQGATDVSSAINYTLAVPEPATPLLVAAAGLAALRRRRRE